MFNNWASDIDVCKYMRWSPHKNEEETKEKLNIWIDSYNKESFYQWAIVLKKIDNLDCKVLRIEEDIEIDEKLLRIKELITGI